MDKEKRKQKNSFIPKVSLVQDQVDAIRGYTTFGIYHTSRGGAMDGKGRGMGESSFAHPQKNFVD
jgi:hypothetical protein